MIENEYGIEVSPDNKITANGEVLPDWVGMLIAKRAREKTLTEVQERIDKWRKNPWDEHRGRIGIDAIIDDMRQSE